MTALPSWADQMKALEKVSDNLINKWRPDGATEAEIQDMNKLALSILACGYLCHVYTDDRRRVVGAGIRHGRDAVIAEMSAIAELGVENAAADIIATRGSHLVLRRVCTWGRGERPEGFHTEVLDIIQIDADERLAARVAFDLDDFEAAIAELDARYIAGEASFTPYFALTQRDRSRLAYQAEIDLTEPAALDLPVSVPVEVLLDETPPP